MTRMKMIHRVFAAVLFSASLSFGQEIFDSVRNVDLVRVRSLLDTDAGLLQAKDNKDNTPLHVAVEIGNREIAELLLDRGADIQAAGQFHFSPLHTAVFAKQKELCRFLLERGADVKALDMFGRTPLVYVPWFSDDDEMAGMLLEYGADVNFVSIEGVKPLELAVFSNRKKLIDLFLSKGARLPETEAEIASYIESCVSNGNCALFQALLAKGGSIQMQNKFGGTLLHSAASGGSTEMAGILLEKSLPIDQRDRYGLTALHLAAGGGKKEVVELLIVRNAALDIHSPNGMTALNCAEKNAHAEIVDLLKANGADTSPQKFPILKGDYVGQKKPGRNSEPFAVGIISTNRNEHSMLTFHPNGSEVYWSPEYGSPILCMKKINGKWTAPEPSEFTFENLDSEPAISPDGKRLYFLSRRPLNEGDQSGDERIWFVERENEGWSEPISVQPIIKTHWQISVSENGTLYFGGGESPEGGADICCSRLVDGNYTEPENLGDSVNSKVHDMKPYIAPDESYLIFSRLGQEDGFGGEDLYISFRKSDGSWTEAKNMGSKINSARSEFNPYITPDGKFFFFSRGGGCDYHWVSAKVLREIMDLERKK